MKTAIRFVLNGKSVALNTDKERALLWVLRTDLELTGPKYGCGNGICGACTVVVGGKAVRSCITPVKNVAGKEVLTVEGLAGNGKLHALQEAFIHHSALQCGYCTSGMLMDAYAFLLAKRNPSREAIAAHMERNLCRCGAYPRILDAIETASHQSGATR